MTRVEYALTSAVMRDAETAAVRAGASLSQLMDRAGSSVAAHVLRSAPDGAVTVLCGGGNNGGDGWVAARELHSAGRDVSVWSVTDPAELPAPAKSAATEAIDAGVRWSRVGPDVRASVLSAPVVVDALLGIGARGAPRGEYAGLIAATNQSGGFVVSIDVPSGVDADTGRVEGEAVRADLTVTFAAPKQGCVLQPGASYVGRLVVADIGIHVPADGGAIEVWDAEDYAALLRLPRWDDSKASRGRVLIVGGSPGLTGAACLAAEGALRSGAGYVTVAVPAPSLPVIEMKLTAPVKLALPTDEAGLLTAEALEVVIEAAERADAVVLGPGLGRTEGARDLALALVRSIDRPLVVDADVLHALGRLESAVLGSAASVITPHHGEAARLLGLLPAEVAGDRVAAARALSATATVAVLKGPSTLIAGSGRLIVNRSGGPGLATLGTGDVLAGVIGAMLAAGLKPVEAAATGAYLHGLAGDAAAAELTELSMTAEDVVAHLPHAVRHLLTTRERSSRRTEQ